MWQLPLDTTDDLLLVVPTERLQVRHGLGRELNPEHDFPQAGWQHREQPNKNRIPHAEAALKQKRAAVPFLPAESE